MSNVNELWLSPSITLGKSDHHQLLSLVGTGRDDDIVDDLMQELDRAKVLADAELPADVVRMGSLVRFRTGRDERRVILVYPAEADIGSGKISVLTPVGTALIGLRAGQSITFRTRDGRPQMLTVISVSEPAGEEDDDPGPAAA
jgi:regulator of nucleoside diphosphate kinase